MHRRACLSTANQRKVGISHYVAALVAGYMLEPHLLNQILALLLHLHVQLFGTRHVSESDHGVQDRAAGYEVRVDTWQ